MNVLLPFCYFGNLDYYSHLVQHSSTIELWENMPKRTERARCCIRSAQGTEMLIAPLDRSTHSGPIQDVKLSQEPWLKQHFKSLITNYNSSPFFEHFIPELEAFFQSTFTYLIDLNTSAHALVEELLGRKIPLSFSEEFHKEFDGLDRREHFRSSKFTSCFTNPTYEQVFSERLDFCPSLSVLDLLFNEGPAGYQYLTQNPFIHGENIGKETRLSVQ